MRLKKIIAVHLLVLGLILPQAVSAEDFVVNVKVKLDNIVPEVTDILIQCYLRDITQASRMIGEGEKKINMPANGYLNTTIQVKFNALPGENPGHATNFSCWLHFFKGTVKGGPLAEDSPQCNSHLADWKCAKPGTPYDRSASGTIP